MHNLLHLYKKLLFNRNIYINFFFHFKNLDDTRKDPDFVPERVTNNNNNTMSTLTSTIENHRENRQKKSKKKKEEVNLLDPYQKENVEGLVAPDYEQIIIKKYEETETKKKGNLHMCIFCGKDQTNLKRHLKRHHKDKDEVKKMMNDSKGNPNSRKPMQNLIHQGDYVYNINAGLNKGDLRIAKKPTKRDRSALEYLPCSKCKSMILQENYTTHVSVCTGQAAKNSHDTLLIGRRLLPRYHHSANKNMRKIILASLRQDTVFHNIRNDHLLIEYGNEQTSNLRGLQHKANICTRLRRLSKIKIGMISKDKTIKNLWDCLIPSNSTHIVEVIESLANEGRPIEEFVQFPTVLENLRGLIVEISETKRVMSIKKGDDQSEKEVANFLICFKSDYKKRLARVARESHGNVRRHKTVVMPTSNDINKFLKYLNDQLIKNYTQLEEKFEETTYLSLMKGTLVSLQVFNRRRPGDVERITIQDWECLKHIDESISSFSELNSDLQHMTKQYALLTVRGKLGRDIQLLVTPVVQLCGKLLLQHRQKLDIPISNKYFFALPQSPLNAIRHVSAYVTLKKFADESGIENPLTFTATRLRKQLATACIKLNLSDAELGDLARYMGHHKDIHVANYRMNIVERDIPLFLNFINTALKSSMTEEEVIGKNSFIIY